MNLALVIVTLAVLTPYFGDLPKSTLAAIVIAAILPLLRTSGLRRLYRVDRADFLVALACLVGVLVLGVLGGIVVAVVASLVALVYRSFRPVVAVLGRARLHESDEDMAYRDVSRHAVAETFPGLIIFRFDQELFFANAAFFRDTVRELVRSTTPRPRAILLDATAVTHIDTTALDMLAELDDELQAEGIVLMFARLKGPVRDTIARAGLTELLGPDRYYPTIRHGVAAFLAGPEEADGG
jgi:MFS superfamily sulfate permease-like transporter